MPFSTPPPGGLLAGSQRLYQKYFWEAFGAKNSFILNALIARKYIGVKWIWRLSYLKSPRRNSFNTKAHHSHPLLSIKPWKPCFCNVAWSTGVEYVLLLLKNYCYCPFLELLLLLLTRSFPELLLLLLLLLNAFPKLLLLLLIENFSIDQLCCGVILEQHLVALSRNNWPKYYMILAKHDIQHPSITSWETFSLKSTTYLSFWS